MFKVHDESVDSIGPNEALPDFENIAWNIQNQLPGLVMYEKTEEWHFRGFFGTSVRIVNTLWEFLVCDRFRPRGGHPKHRFDPKQGLGGAVVGASHGAVDPKIHRKWVWAFIEAITNLIDMVVSF